MELILILFTVMILTPILAYAVMKFGTAGYLRAKRREENKTKNNEQKN